MIESFLIGKNVKSINSRDKEPESLPLFRFHNVIVIKGYLGGPTSPGSAGHERTEQKRKASTRPKTLTEFDKQVSWQSKNRVR